MRSLKNKYRIYLWISYIIGIIGVSIGLIPEFLENDIVRENGAMVLLGLFTALLSWLLGLIVFKEKARIVDDVVYGDNAIARWNYDSSDWKRKIMESEDNPISNNIGMAIILVAIFSLIFLPISVINGSKLYFYIYILLVSLSLLSIIMTVRKIRYMKEKAYVVIGRDGVILNGEIEWWRGRGRGFEEAYYDDSSSSIVVVYFNYFKKGIRRNIVTIPVPEYVEIDIEYVLSNINMEEHWEEDNFYDKRGK